MVLSGSGEEVQTEVKDALFPIREMLARRALESASAVPERPHSSSPVPLTTTATTIPTTQQIVVPPELQQRENIIAEIMDSVKQ
jgi:hypothetical protein